MVVDPEFIDRNTLRKADWKTINAKTKGMFDNDNTPLSMILEFASKCGAPPSDCDSMIRSLSLHKKCKVGIIITEEKVGFAE